MERIPQPTHEDEQEWTHGRVARMGKFSSLPTRREDEESAGGVGTWERTDSTATPTTTQQ